MGACQGKSLPLSPNSTKLLGVLIRLPPRSYQIILVGPKKFLQFLTKNKRHIFHFHQEFRSTTYSPFCSNTFCYFLGNFIIPSSPNFLSFWAKTVPGAFQGTGIFSIKRILWGPKQMDIWRHNVWWIRQMNQNFPAKL